MNCCSSKHPAEKAKSYDLYILSQKYRFSAQELIQYQNRFTRISKGKEMTLKKFRKSMGLLGFKSTSILADRIFKCMDQNNNDHVGFEEFLEYMDVVMHGDHAEKTLQSFRLISQNQSVINYAEFRDWLKSVWKMFNKLTGSEIKSSEEKIKSHFAAIDYKKDGVIDFEEYSKSASNKSSMLQWFNFMSMGVETKEAEKTEEPESNYRKRIESIENNVSVCIKILKEKSFERDFSPVIEVSSVNEFTPERGPKCFSSMEFSHAGDTDSPTFFSDEESSPVKSSNSSMILDKLNELSEKLQKLKLDEENFKKNTVFNVPKINNEKKKNKISWGDEDWNLILYMMLGIQKSVKASTIDVNKEISLEDFKEEVKFSLAPKKKKENRSKLCRFTDFTPSIFARIRSIFSVESNLYLKSLGVEKIMASLLQSEFSSLVGLVSSGKSGSFFYFSDDGKYVLKTMSLDEFSFFTRILPDYYTYLSENPQSLIPKFFGFHSIEYFASKEKLVKNFIIMENLFSSGHEIHLRFDLKGSTVGRTTDPGEDFSIARKDLDFNRSGMKVKLGLKEKEKLLVQIRSDCEFFARLSIIDYSLLLGVHHLKGEIPNLNELKNAFLSNDRQYLYFIGIIDVLTLYNTKKKLENMVKTPFLGKAISCVPPKQYAERFVNYISNIFE